MPRIQEMLTEMSHAFEAKVPPDYSLKVLLEVTSVDPGVVQWHVGCAGGEIEYGEGAISDPDTTFTLDEDTLDKLYSGTWNGLTAAGRAAVSDPAPLNFSMPAGTDPLEAMRRGYFFVTHFFSTSDPTMLRFGPGHTRKVHGAGACPLFYHQGLRSAYYCVTTDDILNEDGARDPMFQAFLVIAGTGTATVKEQDIEVAPGDAVFIPPQSVHMLRTDGPDPLEIIWLAWGEGA